MKHIKTQAEFETLIKENNNVIIDFYATWCGPCKMLAPIFEQVSQEKENVTFVKVDVDELRDLAMEYRIASVPTVILFKDGEFIAQTMGFRPKQQFTDALEKVINM